MLDSTIEALQCSREHSVGEFVAQTDWRRPSAKLMTWEETTVLNFLGETPETWYSRREIARKAINRRIYEEDPNWAVGAITSLASRGLIEENVAGTYKLKKKRL